MSPFSFLVAFKRRTVRIFAELYLEADDYNKAEVGDLLGVGSLRVVIALLDNRREGSFVKMPQNNGQRTLPRIKLG